MVFTSNYIQLFFTTLGSFPLDSFNTTASDMYFAELRLLDLWIDYLDTESSYEYTSICEIPLKSQLQQLYRKNDLITECLEQSIKQSDLT